MFTYPNYPYLLNSIYVYRIDINLRQEHLVTVESKQANPLGAEMELIDRSVAGEGVRIDKGKGAKKGTKIDINSE